MTIEKYFSLEEVSILINISENPQKEFFSAGT
jgi:hypothetical protein